MEAAPPVMVVTDTETNHGNAVGETIDRIGAATSSSHGVVYSMVSGWGHLSIDERQRAISELNDCRYTEYWLLISNIHPRRQLDSQDLS